MEQIIFDDGFSVKIGQKVRFNTRYGSRGKGIVTKISVGSNSPVKICLEPTYEIKGSLDGWFCYNGKYGFDRLRDHGIYGGELERDI